MPSPASSAKRSGVKKTSTPIFSNILRPSYFLHWWSWGSYIDVSWWRRLVYRLMMPKALLRFPVSIYLSTLFGSIHSCSARKTSNNLFTSPPSQPSLLFQNCPDVCREIIIPFCFFHWWFWSLEHSIQETSSSLRFLDKVLVSGTIQQQSTDHGGCSPFSVASDIQEGLGSFGRKIRLLCVVCPRPFGILPLLPLNQY